MRVNPRSVDTSAWLGLPADQRPRTDGVHFKDKVDGSGSEVSLSEAIKRLKPALVRQIIDAHNMDQVHLCMWCLWCMCVCMYMCMYVGYHTSSLMFVRMKLCVGHYILPHTH